jgi:hypothetical protein
MPRKKQTKWVQYGSEYKTKWLPERRFRVTFTGRDTELEEILDHIRGYGEVELKEVEVEVEVEVPE